MSDFYFRRLQLHEDRSERKFLILCSVKMPELDNNQIEYFKRITAAVYIKSYVCYNELPLSTTYP